MVLFFAVEAKATTWYVDATNGSDSSSCNTTANPCKTLDYTANSNMQGGDTLYLKGTFTDQVNFGAPKSGSSSAYTTVTTWPGEATAILNVTSMPMAVFLSSNTNYVKLENLEIKNPQFTGINIGSNNSNIIINRVSVHGCPQMGINISDTSSYISILNSFLYNNGTAPGGSTGINLGAVNNIYIYNNSFYNNKENTGTAGSVINVNTGANSLYLKNNIFSTSNNVVSMQELPATLSFDYNNYYSTTAYAITIGNDTRYTVTQWQTATSQDTHSKENDPLFVNTTSGSEDLHLQNASTMIDAGTTISDNLVDFDNETRPYNIYDIGADELPIPSAPTAPAVTGQTTTTANLSWTASPTTTTSYTLEYGTDSTYATVTSVAGLTTTAYAFTGLTANTTYYYRVKAIYTGITDYSSAYTTGSFITVPDAPTNLAVTTRKATKMTLTWDAPTGTITSYNVAYSTAENFSTDMQTVTATTNTVEVTGLSANTAYYFVVVASNSTLNSAASTISATRTKPAKIKKVTIPAKYLTSTTAKVKWQKPAHKSGLKYQVRLMNKHGKKIKTYKLTAKLFKNLENLTASTVYKIKVRAKYDKDNYGAWSKIKKFTTIIE